MRKPTTAEVERGEILRLLAEMSFRPATPKTILAHLDYMGYAINNDRLRFHLNYLCEKRFVEIEMADHDLGEDERIRVVKITPAGIDLLDRRKKGDSGVRF